MSDLITTNVLIVGAGPSGMTAALALARFGISSIIIDRRESLYLDPRAHALNSRTLEIFASLGVDVERFKAAATPTEESNCVRFVETLTGGEFGQLPYERMAASEDLPSPYPLINIAQPATEQVLQDAVASLDSVQVLRPWKWQSCEQRADGVESTVVDDVGQERRIFSRFLIGADGAGSPVRESQGIAMRGMGIVQDFITIHFKADLSALVRDNPAILYWVLKQDCLGTFIAFDIHDNWVFMYAYDEADAEFASFTESRCLDLLHRAIGRSDVDIDIQSIGKWVLGSQVAESYRSQNVFLVGDAAHRYPPSGGLGLNTGVGDAHNLAWKLAAVLQDWAWPGLLDTYHPERERVAQINADFSTENAGKLFSVFLSTGALMPEGMQPSFESLKNDSTRWSQIQAAIEDQRDHFDGLALHIGQHYGRSGAPELRSDSFQFADPGARFPHTWLLVDGVRASSLDLLSGTEFTVIAREGVALKDRHGDSVIPYRIKREGVDFSAPADSMTTLGLHEASAVLVRPDGHIAAQLTGEAIADEALQDVLRAAVAKFPAFDPCAELQGEPGHEI